MIKKLLREEFEKLIAGKKTYRIRDFRARQGTRARDFVPLVFNVSDFRPLPRDHVLVTAETPLSDRMRYGPPYHITNRPVDREKVRVLLELTNKRKEKEHPTPFDKIVLETLDHVTKTLESVGKETDPVWCGTLSALLRNEEAYMSLRLLKSRASRIKQHATTFAEIVAAENEE